MMDGVNIDVAVVQLVELSIVIAVVDGSNPSGHPNNEGMVEKIHGPQNAVAVAKRIVSI